MKKIISNNELEFLPAALEIQETPPLPMGRNILWAIMLFFTIGVAWALIGEVDIVGVAQGKIVPSGQVKLIQPLETGLVTKIHVKEGDDVKAGDPLLELDTTLTDAENIQAKEQQLALQLDRVRLNRLLSSIEPSETTETEVLPFPDSVSNEQIKITKQRIHSQLKEHQAQIAALKDEYAQRQAEKAAGEQRIQQLDETIPLISERANAMKELVDKKMLPRMQWLEVEEERIEQVKERDIQKKTTASLNAALANINQRINILKAEFENQLLTELADTENRITALQQEVIKSEQRVQYQILTAPVKGRVHQLGIHTIGGVVTPAQVLMRIVPEEGAIEVEAWVQNKDIGFIHEGQEAEIKVETFPFTKYGTIDGEISTLSNDATPDKNLGLVYATKVKLAKTTMQINEKTINLTPGMAVTIEMKMGKRRLIEFLMSPLLRYKDESVRER